jgi:hypothetical protein
MKEYCFNCILYSRKPLGSYKCIGFYEGINIALISPVTPCLAQGRTLFLVKETDGEIAP